MKGFFVVDSNPKENFDIKCELHPDRAKEVVPSEQEKLYIEVESTNNVIKSLHNTKDEIKSKYFNKLLSLSQAGLVGDTAQPELSLNSLDKLRDEIVLIEGQRIKNEYMKSLGQKAIILSVGAFLLYLVTLSFEKTQPLSMYFLTIVGAFIGTWISFGARKLSITFEQLSLLEEDMMSSWISLLYIGACSAVFLLFLNTQVISIGVGTLSTTSIKSSSEMQISIGVLCGLIESKIGISIYKKAVTLISD